MPEIPGGLGQDLDDPKALHLETCRDCQDAKDHGMLVHGSQKLRECLFLLSSLCNICCSSGVCSLVCSENFAENHKRECVCGVASSSNAFSAEEEEEGDDISVSTSGTSQGADAVTNSVTQVVNQDVVSEAPTTSPRQDQMPHDALEGSSENHPLKAAEDIVTASHNQELQVSHSASYFKQSADQQVGEGPDRTTACPSSSHGTSSDHLIRGFPAAGRWDGGLDGQTDEYLGLVERWVDHPLVESEDVSSILVTNMEIEEQNDETFLYNPASGAGPLGSNLRGTLVASPLEGNLDNGSNLWCWYIAGHSISPSPGVMSCTDMHVVKADWPQYGIDEIPQ